MSDTLRIKFVSKTPPDQIEALWRPLLPEGSSRIGRCEFIFDADAQGYDTLVVYEDLPPNLGETRILRTETLACAKANTLLLTTEPASIRIDGPHYLRQFGHVWTAKHPSLVRHPHQIRDTPPLRFFYGRNLEGGSHRQVDAFVPTKTKTLSGMSSTKAMSHTVHAKRLEFMQALKDHFGNGFDLFGRGIQPVNDKAEAMDDYRYHVAIENHVEPGHFTEKLTDCFLAGCLPFYFGDSAYSNVFPERAVIPINIYNFEHAVRTIEQAIENGEFSKRHDALAEARRITLERFNSLRAVARTIETIYDPKALGGGVIHGRHAFRRHHPVKAVSDALFSRLAKRSPFASPLQGLDKD